ncbi:MAG: TIGR04283 family arsenosugar biosynthesis glycosyltransferase [Desulfomonilaceae bacterium]
MNSLMDAKDKLSRNHVIVFTRYPEAGKTKTRLKAELGPEGAAELQRVMSEHAIGRVRELAKTGPISVEVRYQGGSTSLMKQWLGADVLYREQDGNDLGDRMLRAFDEAFRDGAGHVLLIGTDCSGISAQILEKGFQELERNDLVLGPAADGGYYLIGLKRVYPELFSTIPWGTENVLERSLGIARLQGLSTILLDLLHDVDRPEDLDIWRNIERSFASLISVIIPTWNEESNISVLLEELVGAPNVETIVVDGNSSDRTREIAASHNIKVMSSPRCRAIQMNTGAKNARGDILLFLHADTRLPPNWALMVRDALAEPGTTAGSFEFAIDDKMKKLRIIERLTNFRSRKFQLPYGDQAIFLKADLFRRIGGYNDLPIMEDFELIRRLRKFGRIITLPARAFTSGHRWRNLGILRTTLINQAVILGYFLGISPARLARWYHRDSRDDVRN